jgi:hypothetical protein
LVVDVEPLRELTGRVTESRGLGARGWPTAGLARKIRELIGFRVVPETLSVELGRHPIGT